MRNDNGQKFEDISSHSEGFHEFEDIESNSNGKIREPFSEQSKSSSLRMTQAPSVRRSNELGPTSQAERLKKKPKRKKDTRSGRSKGDKSEPVYTNYKYPDRHSDEKGIYIDRELNAERRGRRKKKHRLSLTKRILLSVFLVFVTVLLIFFAVFSGMMSKMERPQGQEKHRINPFIDESELIWNRDVKNILLIGVDARENESVSRSDTMMLLSVDSRNKKLKLTSFLRDSYVDIPGEGENKLNAATVKGGTELLLNTLEYNFKIRIDNYVTVDFEAFEELIDSIGGVDVRVEPYEADYLNRTWRQWSLTGNRLRFYSGDAVHMNGEQALMFSRIRKLDSDFCRTERQRRVISAVKDKVLSDPSGITRVANRVLPLIKTDMSTSKTTLTAMKLLPAVSDYEVVQQSVPFEGTWHSESKFCGSCLVFDINDASQRLIDFIYNDIYEGKEPAAESTP